jgi:hypothetical protein
MSRSSSTIQDGSLELLLDTICNTFGGIVFISMLVVVLLNMSGETASSQPPTEESALELQQLTAELEAAQARLRILHQATRQRDDTIQQLVSKDQLILARKLVEAEALRTTRIEETATITKVIADHQKSVNTISQDLAERKKELESLQNQLQVQSDSMRREVESRSQNVTPPKLEELPNHRSIDMILKGGRLVALSRISESGLENRNADELNVSFEGGTEFVEPKTGAGVAVALDKSTKAQIQSALNQFNPNRHVIKIWIWPDSFAHYQVIQEILAESRFRSKLEPVRQDTRLHVGKPTGPVLGQ